MNTRSSSRRQLQQHAGEDRDVNQSPEELSTQTPNRKGGEKPPAESKKARRTAPTSSAPRKTAAEKKWEAPYVYTNTKSPLAQADLRAILLHPLAWDILGPEQRRDILAKFPAGTPILDAGTDEARPDPEALGNDDGFRNDCARYCENIELERHDDEWLRQAWTAHERQRRGDFDRHLRAEFEEQWDIKLPDTKQPPPASSQSSEATSGYDSSGSISALDATPSPKLKLGTNAARDTPSPYTTKRLEITAQAPAEAEGSSTSRTLPNIDAHLGKAPMPRHTKLTFALDPGVGSSHVSGVKKAGEPSSAAGGKQGHAEEASKLADADTTMIIGHGPA